MIEANVKVNCKSCAADVTWATTNNGKRTLLDEPTSDGEYAFLTLTGDQAIAVKLDGKSLATAREAGQELRCCHFLTCPDREERRA